MQSILIVWRRRHAHLSVRGQAGISRTDSYESMEYLSQSRQSSIRGAISWHSQHLAQKAGYMGKIELYPASKDRKAEYEMPRNVQVEWTE